MWLCKIGPLSQSVDPGGLQGPSYISHLDSKILQGPALKVDPASKGMVALYTLGGHMSINPLEGQMVAVLHTGGSRPLLLNHPGLFGSPASKES